MTTTESTDLILEILKKYPSREPVQCTPSSNFDQKNQVYH